MTNDHTFTVKSGVRTATLETRKKAVQQAVDWSDNRKRARVKRSDGNVEMVFKDGGLERYVHHIPRRRRRRRH